MEGTTAAATGAGPGGRVDSSCTDSGSGAIDRPFCTIGAAARVVGAGQTVQVAAGTYPENVDVSTSGTSSAPITFTAASGATVTRSGQTRSGIYFSNVSDSLVSGNTVDHNTDSGIHLTSGSTRDEIRGNVAFSNAQGWQRAATGIRLYSSPGNTVDRN